MDEKATQLHAIASLKVLLDATKPQDGVNGTGGAGPNSRLWSGQPRNRGMFIFLGSFLTLDWNLEQSTEEKINSICNFAWNLNLGLLHFTFF